MKNNWEPFFLHDPRIFHSRLLLSLGGDGYGIYIDRLNLILLYSFYIESKLPNLGDIQAGRIDSLVM